MRKKRKKTPEKIDSCRFNCIL